MLTAAGVHTLRRGCCLNAAFNWRLCVRSYQVSRARFMINSKVRYLPKNLNVTLKRSTVFCGKVGLGISCGLIFKLLQIDCNGTQTGRLVGVEGVNSSPSFNWSKFFQLLKPYWIQLFGAVVAALTCALLNILIPGVLGNLIDILSQASRDNNNYLEDLKKPASTMLLYCSLHSFFTFCYIALLSQIAEGMARKMKVQLFSSIMDQDIEFFDRHRTGELVNRLTVDVHDFKSSFKIVVSQGLRSTAQVVGCSITLLQISPQMSAVMMLVVPTVILIGSFVGSLLRQISFDAKAQTSAVTLLAEEAISNIRTVRSFAMEDIENKLIAEQVAKATALEIRLGRGVAVFQIVVVFLSEVPLTILTSGFLSILKAGTNLFLNGMVLSTIYMGGYLLRTGSITAGDLMAFLVTVQIMQRSFSQLSLLFGTYIKGVHAGARIFALMDLPPGVPLKEGKIIPYHSLVPDIELQHVDFAYPTRPNHKILDDVTLKIRANSTVAIVGPSGSGKSTIAWLIERLYDVKDGIVLVGGEDVKSLNATWLRSKVIGFISQEPLLFATSIMENIRYGKPNAKDSEVIEAAKLANADDFIMSFPNGYQTKVGERGVALSGGQRQRIAIARALLKNPSILILDEATSALDAKSEQLVQHALEKVMKSRTTIVIAHRLSTIINADKIVVLHNGRIVEVGTHRELMKKDGIYASLVAQQMSQNS